MARKRQNAQSGSASKSPKKAKTEPTATETASKSDKSDTTSKRRNRPTRGQRSSTILKEFEEKIRRPNATTSTSASSANESEIDDVKQEKNPGDANGDERMKQQDADEPESDAEDEDEEGDVNEEEEGEGEDTEEDGGGEDDEGDIPAPVVFQCGTCRSIFGDSYAFVCSNADLLLVTLSAVTNISLSSETVTSKQGIDLGSSYHELLCRQCQTVLGRQYLTTPMQLDPIRNLYSFATPAITSYQLGYPQLGESGEGTSSGFDRMEDATVACNEAVRRLAHDEQEFQRLQQDMKKVQSLFLVMDERLQRLESDDVDSEDDQDETDTATALLTPRKRSPALGSSSNLTPKR